MGWLRRSASIHLTPPAPAADPVSDDVAWLRASNASLRADLETCRTEARRLRAALAEATGPQAAARITRLERELERLRRFCVQQEDRLARAEGRPTQGALAPIGGAL